MRVLRETTRCTSGAARSAAAVVAVLLVTGAAGASAQPAAPPDAWTQFRGTSALTGASAASVPDVL